MSFARTIAARLLVAALWAFAGAAAAQSTFERASDNPVALVADRIEFDSETGVLTAEGDVEVYQLGRTLTASRIVYNDRTGRIAAEGPLTLRTESGEIVFADAADLDAQLRDGLIRGAKTVIANGGAKISAVEARRVDNRYNVLSKAVFSPCEVCAENPVPLWRIRARQIIHDEEAGEIHYEDAYFDVMGVTVGALPYFRHPSPEVRRASGFLAPTFERDRAYGVAVKQPYYLVIDDHSDVTLTPFLSYGDGALLEVEYRRLFDRGGIDLTVIGGVTNYGDDNRGARARIGAFGAGEYEVEDGVFVGFELKASADDPFFRRYDYFDDDRLTSEAYVRAYDGRNYATVTAAYLQSLRANDPQDQIPYVLPEFSARYVADTPFIGGEVGLSLDGVGLVRDDGRDTGRVTVGADWSREVVTDGGLVLRGFADARLDYYRIEDDPAFDEDAARFLPRAGIEARMPFSRVDEAGGLHIVEPIVQFVLAPEDIFSGDVPNDDSVLVEYDTLNVFETDRQVGFDRIETGPRVTVGGRYERIFAQGIGFRAAAGRIFRFEDISDFSAGSGLAVDDTSYVASFGLTYRDSFHVTTNWQLSNDFGVERADIAATARFQPLTLFAYYFFVDQDPAALSFDDRSELTLGGALELDRNWTIGADARRDLIADRFVTAGAVLSYHDECAGVDFYARRRFTESVSAPDGTSVGVRVRLFGAGGGDRSRSSGVCAYRAPGGE